MRQGKLTPEEAEEHPQRSIITRALGPEPTVEVDTRTHRARAGDIYLLCSDGLTTMLPEARIGEILVQNQGLKGAGEALLAAANAAGGRDNITAILFRLEDVRAEHERQDIVGSGEEADTGVLARPLRVSCSQTSTSPRSASPQLARDRPRRARSSRVGLQPGALEKTHRRRQRVRVSLTILVGLVIVGAGAHLASQSIYFIATNKRGLVTIYSGFPYTLPGKINLYTQYYVSGVPASSVPPGRRHTLLSHELRSETKASELSCPHPRTRTGKR